MKKVAILGIVAVVALFVFYMLRKKGETKTELDKVKDHTKPQDDVVVRPSEPILTPKVDLSDVLKNSKVAVAEPTPIKLHPAPSPVGNFAI